MVQTDIAAFHRLLRRISAGGRSPNILALCGAGLSAASGLPTFRGATGALWQTHDPMQLATPEAFDANPGLVWRFYAYRRAAALRAKPNNGHFALAALARACPDFLCLTQNVDGISTRAGHPPEQLRALHGELFDLKCADPNCAYVDYDHFDEPVCPALVSAATDDGTVNSSQPSPHIPPEDLPVCLSCRSRGRFSLLRPGVVWFGEMLDEAMLQDIDRWIAQHKTLDLMLVIGTSAEVAPAVGYIMDARNAGAVIANINPDALSPSNLRMLGHTGHDGRNGFAFAGDASQLLPQLLQPLIGDLPPAGAGDEDRVPGGPQN